MKREQNMVITPAGESYNRDCELVKRFTVQRPGSGEHIVVVRCSTDTGTPQEETCDCRGFQFRHTCSHIKAVYEAGVLSCEWD